MIGTAKDSAELGAIGLSLWTVAFGWYFIGTARIKAAWDRLLVRLGTKSPAVPPKPRRKRDIAAD